jgi:hypothetical protein
MGDKTATVRLDVKGDGFRSGMNKAKQDVARGAKEMGSSLSSAMNEGAKGGVNAIKGMLGTIKNAAMGLSGIFGGIGFAELVKGSLDSRAQFVNLSMAIEAGSGRIVEWQKLQKESRAIAKQWGQDNALLGKSFGDVYAGTQNLDFAAQSVETIAIAARGTGEEVENLTKIAGVLNQKFGITARELPEAMAAVYGAAGAMGPGGLEKLGEDFGEIGGKAKTMGLTGVEGMKQMLGWLAKAQQETGRFEQAMTALPQIFDQIIERTGKGGILESGGKVPIKIQTVDEQGQPRSPADIVADIIAKTGGDATALGEFGFGGEGLQTVKALAKDFQAEMKATGGDIDASRAAVTRALMGAAESSVDWSRIQERASDNMKGPAANITTAIETMKEAFEDPGMQSAIESLAENLPELAEGVAKAVQFIVKNPIMSAGVLLGGTGIRGGIGAGLSAAMQKGGQSAAGSIQGAMTTGGTTAAKSIAGSFAGTAALTAAIASWTVAMDQANKLAGDIDTRAKDTAREQEELLQIAERRGEKYAVREVPLAERIFGEGKGRPQDIFGGAEEIITRDPETGAVKVRRKTDMDREFETQGPVKVAPEAAVTTVAGRRRAAAGALRTEAARMAAREDVSNEPGFDWDAFDKRMAAEKASGGAGGEVKVTGIDALRSAVEAGPTRTLRVELTNADAVGEAVASRSSAGKPGTPPAAGHTGG